VVSSFKLIGNLNKKLCSTAELRRESLKVSSSVVFFTFRVDRKKELSMSATHNTQSTVAAGPVLYVALELGWNSWKLAFTIGMGQKPRMRTVTGRNTGVLLAEIKKAKRRFGLSEEAPVLSCYEAGRDGFWLHRALLASGVHNQVVDSASIEVNRRKRRAKSDGLDATKLVEMLIRWHNGERKVWRVVNAPSAEDEDLRQPHRELMELKVERTSHVNRIKALLASVGMSITVTARLPQQLERLRRLCDDAPVPTEMQRRILREFERWQLVSLQIRELESQRAKDLQDDETPGVEKMRQLIKLKGVGENSAWILVRELFGWRQIRNGHELGSLAGLTPTPYDSGGKRSEQGISKAGNRRVRCVMVELSWCWLRYQPTSELSRWYQRRFGKGNSRLRKVGIVALARKLLIALWRYLETGEPPKKARLKGAKLIVRLKRAS
jgi:transposase